MNRKQQVWTGLLAAVLMLLLILDARTALSGARDGLNICLYTVIPSLLPFLFLSALISSAASAESGTILVPIGRLCKMPIGTEIILLLGLLGGYPVGAQSIYQAYREGRLEKADAQRLLAFCSNAGPAFIFGIMGSAFPSPLYAFMIWLVQILSAIIVGIIIPGKPRSYQRKGITQWTSPSAALEKSLKALGAICGWIILFKVVIALADRWILWILPSQPSGMIYGILELTSGCLALAGSGKMGQIFIFGCCYLSFGGLCVLMQTASVVKDLGIRSYIQGKLLQCCICFTISVVFQNILFSPPERMHLNPLFAVPAIVIILAPQIKKRVEKRIHPVYNNK